MLSRDSWKSLRYKVSTKFKESDQNLGLVNININLQTYLFSINSIGMITKPDRTEEHSY